MTVSAVEVETEQPLPEVTLRTMPLGVMLETIGRLYVRTIAQMALAVVIVAVPGFVVLALVGRAVRSAYQNAPATVVARIGEIVATIGVISLGFLVIGGLAIAICLKIAADAYFGGPPSLLRALRFSITRWPAVLGINLLVGFVFLVASGVNFAAELKLGQAAGLVSLVVYLFVAWFSVSTMFAIPCAVFERLSIGKAIGRSMQLIDGARLGCFGVGLLLAIFYAVCFDLLSRVLSATIVLGDASARSLTVRVVIAVALPWVLVWPISAIFVALRYLELRASTDRIPSVEPLAFAVGSQPSRKGLVYRLASGESGGGLGWPPAHGGFPRPPTPWRPSGPFGTFGAVAPGGPGGPGGPVAPGMPGGAAGPGGPVGPVQQGGSPDGADATLPPFFRRPHHGGDNHGEGEAPLPPFHGPRQ